MPTATCQILYMWFAILHERRDIAHFAVTNHPCWLAGPVAPDAFPFDSTPRYLTFDDDPTFRSQVEGAVKSFGIKSKRTAPRSPWQNAISERWVGACRRELLTEVVVFNERHLARLISDSTSYYRLDRRHLSLQRDAPAGRRSVQASALPYREKPSLFYESVVCTTGMTGRKLREKRADE